MVAWWHYLAAFFAALFLVNGVPHFVAGLMGRKFPSPFVGGPPNLDTAERNILWGGINFLVGLVLLWLIRDSLANLGILIEMALTGWLFAWLLSRTFSKLD